MANTIKHFYKRSPPSSSSSSFSPIKSTNAHNYADDDTLPAHGDTVNENTISLEKGAEEALSWFLSNGISENADKFQAIFARNDKKALQGFHQR